MSRCTEGCRISESYLRLNARQRASVSGLALAQASSSTLGASSGTQRS